MSWRPAASVMLPEVAVFSTTTFSSIQRLKALDGLSVKVYDPSCGTEIAPCDCVTPSAVRVARPGVSSA